MKSAQIINLSTGTARAKTDRADAGALLGASIITTGPAKGHGFAVDRDLVDAVALGIEGKRGRWTHGGDDGLARDLGEWQNVRVETFNLCRPCGLETLSPVVEEGSLAEGSTPPGCTVCDAPFELAARAVGDFKFSKSAWMLQPDGLGVPAPEYLMARADEDPSSLGISIVAALEFAELEDGQRVGRLEAPADLRRADIVGDPAANPLGLSEGTAEAETPAKAEEVEEAPAALGEPAEAAEAAYVVADLETLADTKHAAELAEREARIVELTAQLMAAEAREFARLAEEREAFVLGLNARAIEGEAAPLTAEQLGDVRAALELSEGLGRKLGEAYLAAALAPVHTGHLVELEQQSERDAYLKACREHVEKRRAARAARRKKSTNGETR